MSTWNYRVIRYDYPVKVPGTDSQETASTYRIFEVYYDKNGNIEGRSEGAIAPYGETLGELKADLEYLTEALYKPVLVEIDGTLVEEKRNA